MEDLVAEHLKNKYWERIDSVKDALKDFEFYRDSKESLLDCIIRRLAKEEAGTDTDQVLLEAKSSDGQTSHAKAKFHSVAEACLEQLELLPQLSLILEKAEILYKAFLPQKLIWNQGWFKTIELELDKQTGKYGRYVHYGYSSGQPTLSTQLSQRLQRPPVIQPLLDSDVEPGSPGPDACIEWSEHSGGWVLKENGEEKFHLVSGLASDAGFWRASQRSETDRLVHVSVSGKRIFERNSLRELRECFARGLKVEDIVSQVQTACAGPFEEQKPLVKDISEMVRAMWVVAMKLGLAEEERPPSRTADLGMLFSTMVRLASLHLEGDLCDLLRKKLEPFGEPDLTVKVLEQCKFWNEMVLTVSDLHDVHTSYIPRLFHRLCHWSSRPAENSEVAPEDGDADGLRFLAISETHGWEWDLDLNLPTGQKAEVLLHCGNLLFKSGPTTRFGEPTQHLKDVLMVFDEPPFDKFKWILLIAGEHDKTLSELAEQNPRRLLSILPERVVFLQRKKQDPGLERESAAKDPRLAAMVEGKVSFLRNSEQELKLSKPENSQNSCCVCCAEAVVAAAGLKEAEVDVILTSSPTDELEKGLSDVLSGRKPGAKPHTRVVVGGQRNRVHEEPEKWLSSTVTSELLVPSRSPVFFDLPVCGDQHDDRPQMRPTMSQTISQKWRNLFCIPRAEKEQISGAGRDAPEPQLRSTGSSSSCCRILPDWLRRCFRDPEPLVANWIPRDFVAEETLDAHERKWAGAVKKEILAKEKEWQLAKEKEWQRRRDQHAERAEGGEADAEGDAGDLWPCLFTCDWEAHRQGKLLERLEKWRVEIDVPEAVWEKNLWIKLKTKRWEQILDFRAHEQSLAAESFPVEIHFPKRSRTNLSEYDVCGPAVLWSFQSLVHWIVAGFLPYIAYNTAPDPAPGEAFAQYMWQLWIIFVFLAVHLWRVQIRCLKIIIMAQVHVMGSPFSLFSRELSFSLWWWLMLVFSAFSLMDISAQCLFFGQFMRSVESNTDIPAVWEVTIADSLLFSHCKLVSNITHFFTLGWALMFLQLLYMLLHLFIVENKGVQYDMGIGEKTGSMPQGYRTLASSLAWKLETGQEGEDAFIAGNAHLKWLWPLCHVNSGSHRCWNAKLHLEFLCQDPRQLHGLWRTVRTYVQKRFEQAMDKQNHMAFWHADILRVMATYGRMAAVTWSEQSLVRKRLEQELSQGKVNVARFYQIMHNRLKDFLSRVVLIEILEKGLKLEIQVSVFAIDLALQRDQSPTRPLNKQMRIAIFLSFFSAVYAFWSHLVNLVTLCRLHYRCQEKYMKSGNWLNRRSTTRNQGRVFALLLWYGIGDFILLLFIVHNAFKYVHAKGCEFSMWNIGTGCVQFHWEGTLKNRTLILPHDS